MPMFRRHAITTDHPSIAADFAGLVQRGGMSTLEGDERNPGVPRHIAREAGLMSATELQVRRTTE